MYTGQVKVSTLWQKTQPSYCIEGEKNPSEVLFTTKRLKMLAIFTLTVLYCEKYWKYFKISSRGFVDL